MKRCLSVILTIALIFMFAACTNHKNQQEGTTTSSDVSEAGSHEQVGGSATNKNKNAQKPNANNNNNNNSVNANNNNANNVNANNTAGQNPPAQGKPSSSGQQSNSSNSKEKDKQFSAGNSAFIDINQASQATSQIAKAIYQAWYFAIYEAKDYGDYYETLTHYCRRTGLDSVEVTDAVDTILSDLGYEPGNNDDRYMILQIKSGAVDVVIGVYTANGRLDEIGDLLESAQKNISTLSKEYAEYTDRETLRLYYSEAWAYYNFVLSPTGSFSTLENTINTYENNLRKYNNQLAFTYLF